MSTETVKAMPVVDTKAIDTQVAPFVARAKAAKVTNVEEDAEAKKEFAAGKAIQRFIEGVYEAPKKTLHEAHKAMVAQEKKVLEPVLEGLAIYEKKCLEFKREQERKAQEEADRLAAQAKKEAEELQIREAQQAEEAGDKKLADEILSQPTEVAPVAVQTQLAKVEGVGTQVRWSADVTDLKALVKYVAAKCDEDPGVLCFLEPAMPVLNREAVNKKRLLTIPGVKAVSKEGMSGRTAFRKVE